MTTRPNRRSQAARKWGFWLVVLGSYGFDMLSGRSELRAVTFAIGVAVLFIFDELLAVERLIEERIETAEARIAEQLQQSHRKTIEILLEHSQVLAFLGQSDDPVSH
jgi:hypothetical protein